MLLVTSSARYDNWGFPHIWVPFGKPGVVRGADGDYNIASEDILNPESIATLAGVPVYRWHPETEKGVVTLDNIKDHPSVGVCTDKYRVTPDGGGEVLVRLNCAETLSDIRRQVLCESSPGYAMFNNARAYNHISLLPPGYARGGSKMQIRLEGHSPFQEVYPLNYLSPQMEKELGLLLAGQTEMTQKITALEAKFDALAAPEPVVLLEGETPEAKFYAEGFEQGRLAGKIIADAGAHGYDGDDLDAARAHVIGKAFPEIKIEGFSPDMVSGLYTGALAALGAAAAITATKVEAAATPAAVKVPGVAVTAPAKPNRLKMSK